MNGNTTEEITCPSRVFVLGMLLASGMTALGFAETARATEVFGRVVAGSYYSSEAFSDPTDITGNSAITTESGQVYLRAYDLWNDPLQFTVDLRDKNDFFDKMDIERLQLTDQNTFQAEELSIRGGTASTRYFGSVGRFPVPDAGAITCDGAEAGRYWTPELKTAVFGGLDPRRPDQTYYGFNSDSYSVGTYTVYQPYIASWARNLRFNSAFVAQPVQGNLDRLYFYNQGIYQWNVDGRVTGSVYLDFVPTLYVQTAFFDYHQQWNPAIATDLNLSSIDELEYFRQQNVLERLSPSPYRDASVDFRQALNPLAFLDYLASYGVREADGLSRAEFYMGPTLNRFLASSLSLQSFLGARHNFTADEYFARVNLDYATRDWDVDFTQDYAFRSTVAYGSLDHPETSDLGVSHYFSRDLYATVSGEHAADELVDIWSGFLKISYRFGSPDVAPLREGPLPRGKL